MQSVRRSRVRCLCGCDVPCGSGCTQQATSDGSCRLVIELYVRSVPLTSLTRCFSVYEPDLAIPQSGGDDCVHLGRRFIAEDEDGRYISDIAPQTSSVTVP